MPFDGIFLKAVSEELKGCIGLRIDKINQPAKDELILTFRSLKGSKRLLISVNSMNARLHLTNKPPSNPKTPPMFCMLLRKKLGSGRLTDMWQNGLDRVLNLKFETKDEIGDFHIYIMAVELMGRHSNLIVYDQNTGYILDAIKRVGESMSSVRQIMPNAVYTTPPEQVKLNLMEFSSEEIVDKIKLSGKQTETAIVDTMSGISPLIARELAGRFYDVKANSLDLKDLNTLKNNIDSLKETVEQKDYKYTLILNQNKPIDFAAVDIKQYGNFASKEYLDTAEELLDYFYTERDRIARVKQKSKDLIKTLKNLIDRNIRKYYKRVNELKNSSLKANYKEYGDILSANLTKIKAGAPQVKLTDFYNGGQAVTIKLSPQKTAAQNAQFYYKEYKKSVVALRELKELTERAKGDIEYLKSTLDFVMRTQSEEELSLIKDELSEQGFIKKAVKPTKMSVVKLPPLEFSSSDGYTIYCGRNNKQNDKLTLKKSSKNDLWFHTQKIHGAHVILKTGNEERIPDKTMEEAAMVAAYNSKARDSSNVSVDYTKVANVKKPNGAKPGMVIYNNYKTIIVTPKKEKVDAIRKKN